MARAIILQWYYDDGDSSTYSLNTLSANASAYSVNALNSVYDNNMYKMVTEDFNKSLSSSQDYQDIISVSESCNYVMFHITFSDDAGERQSWWFCSDYEVDNQCKFSYPDANVNDTAYQPGEIDVYYQSKVLKISSSNAGTINGTMYTLTNL